ncbi:hypothetical protein E2320_021825 [Naja naja]|nr:hypothetical protein E2320_021825 [Naja naja]
MKKQNRTSRLPIYLYDLPQQWIQVHFIYEENPVFFPHSCRAQGKYSEKFMVKYEVEARYFQAKLDITRLFFSEVSHKSHNTKEELLLQTLHSSHSAESLLQKPTISSEAIFVSKQVIPWVCA